MVGLSSARAGEPGVPLDSWVYRELDRLRAMGLTPSAAAGFRPRSREEITRLILEARGRAAGTGEERCAWTLSRLELEFAAELDDADAERDVDYFRPVEKVRVSCAWLDDGADVQNDRGREYREGTGARLSVSSRFAWGPLSGFLQWEGRYLEEGNSGEPGGGEREQLTAGRVEEGYLRLSAGPWYVEAGRECLWWGPARHGSLLVSDNARPFDLVRLGNDRPFLLPGPLARLGPVSVELFAARLGEDRAVPEPFLAGARVGIAPFPWLELGASRTAIFGGKGRPVTWTTVGNVLTVHDENEPEGAGDQLASVDWRLTVPWRVQPFEFYGEFGGEDEAGGIFSRCAYVAGLYLPQLGPSALFDLRVEFANTYADGHGGYEMFWYNHNVYTSGYTHQGRVIGHHAGTDARDLYCELGFYPAPGLRLWAAWDREERVVSLDDPELRTEWGLGVEWSPGPRLVLEAAFVREEVSDALDPEAPGEGDRVVLAATWKF